MGKSKSEKKPEGGSGSNGDAQLLEDVRAFAAQLGLGAGGVTGDDAFADFAPKAAKKKISKSKEATLKSDDSEAKVQSKPDRKETPKPAKPANGLPAAAPPPSAPASSSGRSLLKRDDMGLWYEIAATLPALKPDAKPPKPDFLALKQTEADQLLANEATAFENAAARQRGSNLQWLQQAQRGGTTSDKVAAMAVLVQEAPMANLRSLDGLVAMAGKRGGARAVVGTALDALKELWLDVLLPPNRKLKFLEQQPLGALPQSREGERCLLFWGFESALKQKYATFISSLESLSLDNLEFVKDRAIKTIYDLLVSRPEQESNLLSLLVNKLGDPERKLASKVGYLLTKLLTKHPAMKGVVLREVERFVFRPGLTDRARYYAVVYLNQMVLSHKDSGVVGAGGGSLARRLVDLYFTLFKLIMEGKVGTAASLAGAAKEKAAKEAAAYAARRGKKKAGAAKEARGGKKETEGKEESMNQGDGRGSGEMDARMLSALITGVRRAFPYVAPDEVEPLIEAHSDALFRLAHTGSFGVATQALLLLHQLMSSRNSISDRFYRALYASLLSPELPRSTKGPMFLSLLYKAVGTDVSPRRVAAFIKRLLQVATEAPANFACGCLMLASQVMKAKPGMWNAVLQPEDKEDDAVETLQDAVDPGNSRKAVQRDGENGEASDSDEEEDMEPDLPSTSGRKTQRGTSLEAAQKPGGGKDGDGPDGSWPSEGGYDMRKRDPQYSHADRACLWELLPLASHAHPSVAAMARTLLAGANVSYDGDPLQMLTLGAFLDKFVQRKAKAGVKGDSAMQPLRAPTTAAAHGHQDLALAEIAGGAAGDVAPDEAFFHTFYSVQAARQPGAAKKKKSAAAAKADDDEELVSDLDDSDSDAADEFLAGEEDGGDEGIGADPDRAAGYDYDQLGAAMDEDSDLGSGSERGGGSEEASIDEEGSLEGAEFSDLSGDEDGSGPDAGGSDEDDSGGEGSLDSLDSLEDLTDDSGSSEDDAAADAEVAELLRRHASAQKQPPMGTKRARTEALMPAQAGNGSLNDLVDEVDEDVNPFELAEGTDSGTDADSDVDSDSDGEGEEGHPSSDEEKQASSDGSGPSDSDIDFDEGLDSDSDDGAGGGRGKRKGDGAVFASADDYAHLIEKDLAGEVDEGEVEAVRTAVLGAKKGKRPSSGGRGGKRQRR